MKLEPLCTVNVNRTHVHKATLHIKLPSPVHYELQIKIHENDHAEDIQRAIGLHFLSIAQVTQFNSNCNEQDPR